VFYSSKRHTIDQRSAELMLHHDGYDGAPARVGVDLDGQRVVITRAPRSPAN